MNSAFVKLGDIADLTVGYVGNMTKEYKEEGIYFFRSLNIKPFYIDKTDLLYISSEFNEKNKKVEIKRGRLGNRSYWSTCNLLRNSERI